MEAHAVAGPEREEVVEVWTGGLEMHVKVGGSGPPLLFVHSAGGPRWTAFNDWLGETHTVYAPDLPGTSPGDPRAIDKIDTFGELLLAYEELVHALGIEGAVAVGESLGGMIVADLAAHFPALLSKLVLLAPAGLWSDEHPPRAIDLISGRPEEAPGYLFFDPSSQAAQDFLALPEDPELIPKIIAALVWAQGCAAKFLWPIPDHGLARRLHRVTAPALIVFGREDRVMPSAFGPEFERLMAGSRLEIIERCGHIPQVEQFERTCEVVGAFLAG
jgi:pimeloyl-ACP methyl ester carboxylesterase